MTARPLARSWLLGVALAGAAVAVPVAARAQDPRLEHRLDPSTRRLVTFVVDSARAAGLPTEPLVDKALEGASKRAPSERIAEAVSRLKADLAAAREILGPYAPTDELVAGARALRAGVHPETLRRFRRERNRRPMTVALVVLGDLVARGIEPDTAANAVLALAARGAGDEELVAFQRGAQLGAPPVPRPGTAGAAGGGVDAQGGYNVPAPGPGVQGGGTPTTRPAPTPRKPRP